MNKLYNKWFLGVWMLIAATMGIQSCSDDHFDIDPEVTGRQTLWETINSNPELSEFANILSRVQYSKSEGNTTKQNYADLFNHAQTFTVWAPKNGTFDYAKWNDLLNDGTVASAYLVENELIRNSMTRYTHIMSGGDSTQIALFNGKSAIFNAAAGTIKGTPITKANIGTSNGVLHIIDGQVAYLPNIYEYLKKGQEIDSLYNFIHSFEELIFNENLSTQGPTIDGNITWVDSITNISNKYLNNGLYARLTSEDSLYVMVMPNNRAWSDAYNKVKGYYNYMPEYVQTVISIGANGEESEESKTTSFSQAELDSITLYRIHNTIARDLVFNTSEQFGHPYTDYNKEGACDSLMSTYGTVFDDPYSAQLFDNKQPIRLSNGYAYVVDNYNYRLEDILLDERIYEAERTYETYTYCTPAYRSINKRLYYVTDSTTMEEADTLIQETVIAAVPERATANPSITFRLSNTLACKYDIYAVMAYNEEAQRPYQFRAYVNYHNNRRTTTRQQLMPIDGVNGSGRNFVSKTPYVDEQGLLQFNDSVLLATDFELPVCYVGLDNAYITLEITSYMTSSERSKYTNELLIDKIVLVPKVRED